MEDTKTKEEQYKEALAMHKSLDEKLQVLQAKRYLTAQEEMEVKLLKKKKLHYKDAMKSLEGDPGKK